MSRCRTATALLRRITSVLSAAQLRQYARWNSHRALAHNALSITASHSQCGSDSNRSLQCHVDALHSIQNQQERSQEAVKFAAQCHRLQTNDALKLLADFLKSDKQITKAYSNRAVYFCIHLALILDNLEIASEFFKWLPPDVHILGTSLRVQLLSRMGHLQEALSQLERVLNEDVPRFDTNHKIVDEALDVLCGAIKSSPDSLLEMRRFRYLQRLLTKYERRSKCTINELLCAKVLDVTDGQLEQDVYGNKLDDATIKKIVKIAPYILSDD
ncbi:unnamed protein product [Anisakis simplex]|uniref:TPR_REGION domain-containing protein n=1 Tax=Anisakis simplex TaxID=6269 RepID=A0A0M3JUN6_ANISI|nr:unnamed protein product [Anisakis simplex]